MQPILIAFYGTLMTGEANSLNPAIREAMTSRGPCVLAGRLYLIGPHKRYPGLKEGEGRVAGELFELAADDASATSLLAALDDYERYYPNDPAKSEYLRKLVRLTAPVVEAWIYVHTGDPARDDMTLITSGDWRMR